MQHLVLLSSGFRQLVSYEVCIMTESASMLQDDPFSRTALDWLISLMWAISPEEKIETNKQTKENRRQRHVHWKPSSLPSTYLFWLTFKYGMPILGFFQIWAAYHLVAAVSSKAFMLFQAQLHRWNIGPPKMRGSTGIGSPNQLPIIKRIKTKCKDLRGDGSVLINIGLIEKPPLSWNSHTLSRGSH